MSRALHLLPVLDDRSRNEFMLARTFAKHKPYLSSWGDCNKKANGCQQMTDCAIHISRYRSCVDTWHAATLNYWMPAHAKTTAPLAMHLLRMLQCCFIISKATVKVTFGRKWEEQNLAPQIRPPLCSRGGCALEVDLFRLRDNSASWRFHRSHQSARIASTNQSARCMMQQLELFGQSYRNGQKLLETGRVVEQAHVQLQTRRRELESERVLVVYQHLTASTTSETRHTPQPLKILTEAR